MGGDPPTYTVELTTRAEEAADRFKDWNGRLLRKAIDELAVDPEADGLQKHAAPAHIGCASCLLYEVTPFRIIYQIVEPARVIVIAIGLDATRL